MKERGIEEGASLPFYRIISFFSSFKIASYFQLKKNSFLFNFNKEFLKSLMKRCSLNEQLFCFLSLG